jgi:hypothetical protein
MSFGHNPPNNQIGYSVVLGDMQYNVETLGVESERRIDRSKNLHDEVKSPERTTRKKPLATLIAHAGGAGGGIR